MTLPAPDLDDRTWADLRQEGVDLIPLHAPKWTDHNFHDPGITLIELLAYRTELELFRANQIGSAHRHAFLRLFGPSFHADGPRASVALLAFDADPARRVPYPRNRIAAGEYFVPLPPPNNGPGEEPNGRVLSGGPTGGPEPLQLPHPGDESPPAWAYGFRATHDTALTGARVAAVQSFDGRRFRNLSENLARGEPVFAWGDDPSAPTGPMDAHPAFYVGLDLGLTPTAPAEPAGDLTLWFVPADEWPDGVTDPPAAPDPQCPTPRSVRVRWEYLSGCDWRPVPTGPPFRDDTDAFTRSGRVVIPAGVLPLAAVARAEKAAEKGDRKTKEAAERDSKRVVGAVPSALFYVRCRLASGRPDAPPRLVGVFADVVLVEQWDTAATPLSFAADPARPTGLVLRDLQLGERVTADVADASKDLVDRGWSLAGNWGEWPATLAAVEPVQRPWTDAPGGADRCVPFVVLGVGTGEPSQSFSLPCPADRVRFPNTDDPRADAPKVITDSLVVWTIEPAWGWDPRGVAKSEWVRVDWREVADLSLAARTTPGYVFDPEVNAVRFGNGEFGQVPPPGAVVVASYRWTFAEAAEVPRKTTWVRMADRDPDRPGSLLGRFRNPLQATGGKAAQSLANALDRLAAAVGAGERLVVAAEKERAETLDGIELPELHRPAMAVTPLDFEYLARTVPGTAVARARAWAGADLRFPGTESAGAVTIAVVPSLPAKRPEPTPELIRAVANDLATRRPVTCRVFVVGPEYHAVRVRATLHAAPGERDAVRERAEAAVRKFLHPLAGGPSGRGWPFGRDVYLGELLGVLGAVDGVRHVSGLRLSGPDGVWGEAAVPIPPQSLVDAVEVDLTALEDA